MTKNLWGDLPDYRALKTPANILTEQANLLSELTDGQLEGGVEKGQSGGDIDLNLFIRARELNNFTFSILKARHSIEIYPIIVIPQQGAPHKTCNNEKEFEIFLEEILKSDKVHRAIKGLLAQINA